MSDNTTKSEAERWVQTGDWNASKSLKSRWLATVGHFIPKALKGDPLYPAEQWYAKLCQAYTNTERHYHNLDHIKHILDLTPITRREFEGVDALLVYQLAAWFHDAVYNSRRTDNEERSADFLDSAAKDLWLPDSIVEMSRSWIMATKKHDSGYPAISVFCDADLAILGSPANVYQEYQAAIRREYDWVLQDDYKAGRSKVLRGFLERERIYRTTAMHDWLESNAIRNLSFELAGLMR